MIRPHVDVANSAFRALFGAAALCTALPAWAAANYTPITPTMSDRTVFSSELVRPQPGGQCGNESSIARELKGEGKKTLGLSSVHVNRTLQELRRQKLITLNGRTLTIQNLRALEELSLFNAEYLHLDYAADKALDGEREGASMRERPV